MSEVTSYTAVGGGRRFITRVFALLLQESPPMRERPVSSLILSGDTNPCRMSGRDCVQSLRSSYTRLYSLCKVTLVILHGVVSPDSSPFCPPPPTARFMTHLC